ncbi:MAG: amidohydrolase [Phycisphaerae bacterium]|nr:amidohydrolase [Phycisphaerae bacterium]
MIVDVHTHFYRADVDWGDHVREDLERCGFALEQWRFEPEDHLAAVEAADAAIVFGLRAAATGWAVPNDAVAEHVRRRPDKLVFFASPDPAQDDAMAELERCHQDLGCQGVKLGPIYQGVHPLDKRNYEIYGYCQRHGLPIMIHMATTFSSGVPLDYARPAHMDQVAVDFPELKIVLPHLGHPWEGEAIAAIRKSPNLFADVSALYYRPWQFYNSMRLLVEYGAQNKVLFGSDFPACTTADSIVGLRGVNAIPKATGLPEIPEDVIEAIIHRDALALLGIRPPCGEA